VLEFLLKQESVMKTNLSTSGHINVLVVLSFLIVPSAQDDDFGVAAVICSVFQYGTTCCSVLQCMV